MKKVIASLAGALVLAWAPAAPGAILSYDFVVDGGGSWSGSSPSPYGLPPQPGPLTGTLTVDNTKTDKTGVVDFSFATGTKTWTEALISDNPLTTVLDYGATGELVDFLMSFEDQPAFLILASTDTMNLVDGTLYIACNGCVGFSPAPATDVPVPGTVALLFGGIVAGAITRRRLIAA